MSNCKLIKSVAKLAVFFTVFGSGLPALALSTQDFQSLWSGQVSHLKTQEDGNFVRVETAPEEGPSYFSATPSNPVSLDKKFIRLKMRINSLEAWAGIELRLVADPSHNFKNYFAINIPFYSDPEFNILQPGHWAEMTLSLGEAKKVGNPNPEKIHHLGFYISGKPVDSSSFAVDFKNIQIEDAVTDAIISMTFDDGYDDHFEAAKIMDKYGLRGTAYVMTNEINGDSYLTSAQLLEMADKYHWSISSHHRIPITELGEQLPQEVSQTFDFLSGLGLPIEPVQHFAYPLGKQGRATTLPYIRQNFSTARVAGGGAETLPPSDWHMLRTYNVTPDKTPEQVAARIAKAKANNEWLILMFHFFTNDKPTDDLTYRYSDFDELCELIAKSGVRVHPVDEVYEAFQ